MTKLFFDIETLPASKNLHKVLEEIHRKKIEDGGKCPNF